MLKRTISSVIGLVLLISIVSYAPQNILFLATAVIGAVGLREFYKAISIKNNPLSSIGVMFGAIYIAFVEMFRTYSSDFSVVFMIVLFILFLATIFNHKKYNVTDIAMTIFGFIYICILISYIPLMRIYDNGLFYVWLIFIVAWGSDTGAYLIGKTFKLGKTKLSKELSPNKTVEGAIGGVVFSTILVSTYIIVAVENNIIQMENYIAISLILGVFGSILSQLGDISASAIKRYEGIKDFGDVIPGHGGILDRFDSILFVAPFVYYIITNLVI